MKTREEFFQAHSAHECPDVLSFFIRDGRLLVRIDGDDIEYDTGLQAGSRIMNQHGAFTYTPVKQALQRGLLKADNGKIYAHFP